MHKYQPLRPIGSGSSGCARLARHRKTNELVCIKEIVTAGKPRDEREAALREASILRDIPPHPHVIGFREAFKEKGCVCIVTEYAEEGDLDAYIKKRRGRLFGEEEIWRWFTELLLALHHVHRHGFLHRDIKTKNIFLSKERRLLLGDFGIARALDPSTSSMATTAIGTPFYMSPELIKGKSYDWKSDVWAVGCVLYELCTLTHAFEARNMKNLYV
ncbi:Serine/threonine-protein kinase Nek1 [Rhizophlyctis rosea]|nr:Serine/threonine-protein kinase Nek1 [Rhizophlyctis rosea]